MKRSVFDRFFAATVALVLAGGIPPAKVHAQVGDPGEVLPADTGTAELQTAFKSKAINEAFNAFVAGSEQLNEKSAKDRKVVDIAAQWFAYRLTWEDYLSETKRTSEKYLPNVHVRLDGVLRSMTSATKSDNSKFRALFSRELAKRIKEVMEKGKLRSKVNAGVMLQRLAQTGEQGLVEDMVDVLESPKYRDIVKLYAIKGLKELLERQPSLPQAPAAREAHIARYGKAVKLLIPYIEKNPEIPKTASPSEKQRIEDVHRYFRREAIRALAQFRLPALSIDAANKKIDGPVAYWLLKVVANDGLAPTASLSEQVEAAYGLFLLRSERTPFQSDLATYAAGRFFEKVMAVKYNADWQRAVRVTTTPKKKGEKRDKTVRSTEPIPVREEPWTLHAARLDHAIGEQLSLTNGASKKKLTDMHGKATLIFTPMRVPFTAKNPPAKAVPAEDITQLGTLLDGIKPAQLSAYLGFDGFNISTAAIE
jgi:hypothetical protein